MFMNREAQIRKLLAGTPVEGEWRQATKHQGARNDLGDNITEVKERGTSRAYILERLLRERPGLHAAVAAGDLSANAAAIEAGFRKKPTPFEQIVKLLPRLSSEQKRKLMELLA
jgi:hypothetical protein